MSRTSSFGWGALGILLALTVMQVLVATGAVSGSAMPTALAMLMAFGNLIVSKTFVSALSDTMISTLLAFGIVAAAGIPMGIVLGASRPANRLMSGLVELLRPVPAIALLPVAILALGIGTEMKVSLASYAALWPMLISTMAGVRDTDQMMVRTGRSFTWSRATIMRRVQLPSALPFIGSGARQSISVALVIVVTLELLGARSGIGAVIREYSAAGRVDFVYAGILTTALLGLVLHLALARLERRLMRWAPQYRRTTP